MRDFVECFSEVQISYDNLLAFDLTKDQKRLVLVRSESFSLAAYCFFFILTIALTSRLACLNRSWSRVLQRLITTFLNLFFTLIRFRRSWSIHGCSFTFRGLLVGMCWLTAARNISDQLVREAFMSFSSKHRSQLIKLS